MPDDKKWPVSNAELLGLGRYLPALVGATLAHPGTFPQEFTSIGVNPRDSARNDLLGITTSQPKAGWYTIGVTYYDRHDAQDDEDFFTLDTAAAELQHWRPGAFEAAHPDYANLHHAAKPHLRLPPKPAT